MNVNNETVEMSITNVSMTNSTPTTTSIPVFDYNWQSDLNYNKPEYIYGLIGIVLNIIILVISKIEKTRKRTNISCYYTVYRVDGDRPRYHAE